MQWNPGQVVVSGRRQVPGEAFPGFRFIWAHLNLLSDAEGAMGPFVGWMSEALSTK
jgi:hypothetical protein